MERSKFIGADNERRTLTKDPIWNLFGTQCIPSSLHKCILSLWNRGGSRSHERDFSNRVFSSPPSSLSPSPSPSPSLSLSLSFALSPLFLASVPFPDRIFLEELNKTRFTVASFNVAYANSPLSRVRVHRRNLPGFIINLNSRETLRYSHGKRCSPWPINRPCQEVTTLLMINGPSLLPLSLKYIHSTVLGLPVHPEIPILLFSTLIPSILANIFWRIFSLSFFFLLTKFHRVT